MQHCLPWTANFCHVSCNKRKKFTPRYRVEVADVLSPPYLTGSCWRPCGLPIQIRERSGFVGLVLLMPLSPSLPLGQTTHSWSSFCRLLPETRNKSAYVLALSLQIPSFPYTKWLPSTTLYMRGMCMIKACPRSGTILSMSNWMNFVPVRTRAGKRGVLLWLMAA